TRYSDFANSQPEALGIKLASPGCSRAGARLQWCRPCAAGTLAALGLVRVVRKSRCKRSTAT
ncbi:MAG: hypothetical protein EBV14_04690, partial [Actinobacteria bacterium]|nr:hypothetical protein [Actinomycetota bacterium]